MNRRNKRNVGRRRGIWHLEEKQKSFLIKISALLLQPRNNDTGSSLLKVQCVLELMSGHMPLPVAQFPYTLTVRDKGLTPQKPERRY